MQSLKNGCTFLFRPQTKTIYIQGPNDMHNGIVVCLGLVYSSLYSLGLVSNHPSLLSNLWPCNLKNMILWGNDYILMSQVKLIWSCRMPLNTYDSLVVWNFLPPYQLIFHHFHHHSHEFHRIVFPTGYTRKRSKNHKGCSTTNENLITIPIHKRVQIFITRDGLWHWNS